MRAPAKAATVDVGCCAEFSAFRSTPLWRATRGRRGAAGSGVSIHAAQKAKQVSLHDDVRQFLDDLASGVIHALPVVGGDHGRIETRTATVSTNIAWLKVLGQF